MDLGRVLGALVSGAAQPARRRQSSAFGARSVEARAARALGAFAAGAIDSWMRGRQQAEPAPPAATPPPSRKLPGAWGQAAPPAPARRLPDTGGPWAAPRPTPPPAPPPAPPGPSAEQAEALLLVRAMIAAARADEAVDAAERQAIATQLDAAGLDAAERDFVLADFDRPLTPEALAREATDPMLRARVYAAAVVGAGQVTPAERRWLDTLAHALHLDRPAAAAIEERLSG